MEKQTSEDQTILDWYYYGFHDELNDKTRPPSSEDLYKIAYKLGCMHAILGDEMPHIDNLSDREVINIIKKHHEDKKV